VQSPYVSRLRLAAELRQLREDHAYSLSDLASRLGVSRQRVSVIENGHEGTSDRLIMAVCDHFSIGVGRRKMLLKAAADTRAKGWWEADAQRMGPRQALAADLELGVSRILEYSISLIPGLLQTPDYSESRVQADPSATTDGFDPVQALRARAERQRRLHAPGGPIYDVVIDELAIRRGTTPAHVMRRQLLHLLELTRANPRLTLRVLPVEAHIVGQSVPRSSFSIYLRQGDDPLVVSVDTMTEDLVLATEPDVGHYRHSYERLRAAALTPQRTAALVLDLSRHDRLQQIGQP
jgi:DNA-binding XRE family transcriptional regulator